MEALTQPETHKKRPGIPIEDLMSIILRWGVFLAAAVIVVGLVLLLMGSHAGGPEFLTSVDIIWTELQSGNPNAIIMSGLLILLATPVVRVLASVAAFAIQGERFHALISIFVLLVLLISLVTGKGH